MGKQIVTQERNPNEPKDTQTFPGKKVTMRPAKYTISHGMLHASCALVEHTTHAHHCSSSANKAAEE